MLLARDPALLPGAVVVAVVGTAGQEPAFAVAFVETAAEMLRTVAEQ